MILAFSGCCPGNLTLTESMLHLPAESMQLLAKLESTQAKIKNLLEIHEKTGDDFFLQLLSCKKIKDLTTDIEETHPVGRLLILM